MVEHTESLVAVAEFRVGRFHFSLVTKFLVDCNAIVTSEVELPFILKCY